MATVTRGGVKIQVPRRVSHHIPVMPIMDGELFQERLRVHFDDIDSEEFQMYKNALIDEYCLNPKAPWEIVGKPKFKLLRQASSVPTPVELKVLELLGGTEALPEEILRILKGILVESDLILIKDMLRDGTPVEKIIKHFLQVSNLNRSICILRLFFFGSQMSLDAQFYSFFYWKLDLKTRSNLHFK